MKEIYNQLTATNKKLKKEIFTQDLAATLGIKRNSKFQLRIILSDLYSIEARMTPIKRNPKTSKEIMKEFHRCHKLLLENYQLIEILKNNK
jgi:hypothetical protein